MFGAWLQRLPPHSPSRPLDFQAGCCPTVKGNRLGWVGSNWFVCSIRPKTKPSTRAEAMFLWPDLSGMAAYLIDIASSTTQSFPRAEAVDAELRRCQRERQSNDQSRGGLRTR